MLVYTFKLNGADITDSVSIGAVVREILSEPLDLGSLLLPFDIKDIEYKLKGLLEIVIQDYDVETETYTTTIKHDLIIIYDNVELSDRIGVYTHDLQVIEYTAKADDYLINSLAYTKSLKDNRQAKFEYVFYDYIHYVGGLEPPNNYGDHILIRKYFHLDKLNIIRQYYCNEPFVLPKVNDAVIGVSFVGNDYVTFETGTAFIRLYNETLSAFINFGDDGDSEDRTRFNLNEKPLSISGLPKGFYVLEYGFRRITEGETETGAIFEKHKDIKVFKFKFKIVNKYDFTIYDLLLNVSNMVSKFGGIESKYYFDSTRIFEIDDEIVDYLKSIEAPQTYVQKATLRQVLNLIFSYVNAISRLKHNGDGLDVLTMDEFDKITGTFELKEIASKNVKRSGSELTIKATSFLERVMPTTLEEPTIITPGKDFYKTVRAIDINMTESSFELKLEKPIYKPIKFTNLIKGVFFRYYHPQADYMVPDGEPFKLELDLSTRFLPKDEWLLKEIPTNFPSVYRVGAFRVNTGMAKWNTENIYWQRGDKSIKMSDIFGTLFKQSLIKNVILSALDEYVTLNPPEPVFVKINDIDVMVVTNFFIFENMFSGIFFKENYGNWLFNLEYISLEDMVVDSERKDDDDNFNYYSSAKLGQSEKLINIMAQTRGAAADLQRTAQRDMIVKRFHENAGSLLKVGMFNKDKRLTITERTLVLHNEFIEAVYSLSKDYNRKAMFRGLQQEYRWSEIPTSKQVFQRNELYKDYIIISKPSEVIQGQHTKIEPLAHEIILETLFNKDYNKSKKITVGYVRTDGMLEDLDESEKKYFILTPITSIGIDSGLLFSFSFDNNMVVGDGLIFHEYSGLGEGSVFNKAVKYTNSDGILNKLWFGLKDKHLDIAEAGVDHDETYPLYRQTFGIHDLFISCHHFDLNNVDSDYLVLYKDSSQVLKITYQISIIPQNPTEYVMGSMFYSNNLLVKARDDKKMYLYLYDDEKYRYGIFDTLKVKDGYYESVLLDDTNTYIIEDFSNNAYDFIFDTELGVDNSKLWAIGDEFGNLYMACNLEDMLGFRSTRLHFRPNIIEIGKE